MIDTALSNSDPDKIDIVSLPDEPRPIDTSLPDTDDRQLGCWWRGWPPITPYYPDVRATIDDIRVQPDGYDDYVLWEVLGKRAPQLTMLRNAPQVFFEPSGVGFNSPIPVEYFRVKKACEYLRDQLDGKARIFINLFTQKMHMDPSFHKYKWRINIWRRFMEFGEGDNDHVNYFCVAFYPIKGYGGNMRSSYPFSWVAQVMDEMYEAREMCLLQEKPDLWMALEFWDGWFWDPEVSEWKQEYDYITDRPLCPDEREYRATTYLAITHGAKGLLYFRYPENMPKGAKGVYRPPVLPPATEPSQEETFDMSVWSHAASVNRELKQLSAKLNYPSADEDKEIVIHELKMWDSPEPAPEEQALSRSTQIGASDSAKKGPNDRAVVPHTHSSTQGMAGAQEGIAGITGTLEAVRLGARAERFGYAIHALGDKPTDNPLVVLPKRSYLYYYLITVNGLNSFVRVKFECKWFPGYDPARRTMQLGLPPVKVLFEEGRTIILQVSEEQSRRSATEEVFFLDEFEPYQRHVYKIPREGFHRRMIQWMALLAEPIRIGNNIW